MVIFSKIKGYLKSNFIVNSVLAVAIIIVLTASLMGSGYIETSAENKAFYRGNTKENNVALMLNVYGGTEYIDGILKVLDAKGVKCTFFLGGCWVANNPKTAKAIADCGHELGSHGYHHLNQSELSDKQNKDEILMAEKQIEAGTGVKPKLFAPPSGDISDKLVSVAESLGYDVIMWSKDTIDWRDKDESLVLQRATTGISNGDFILMHPTAHTLAALPKIIDTLRSNGMNPTTVTNTLAGINAL